MLCRSMVYPNWSVSLPALYGKNYIGAVKDTWNLFKDRGIDAVINDSLVNMGLFFFSKCTATSD